MAVLLAIAHVPDHRLLAVEVGGQHIEPPPLGMFGGNLLEHIVVNIMRDDGLERRVVGQRFLPQQAEHSAQEEHLAGVDGRIGLFQLVVIVRPEECEGCDERAGADAGDDLEPGAAAFLGPAVEDAGAERTGRAAAGHRE